MTIDLSNSAGTFTNQGTIDVDSGQMLTVNGTGGTGTFTQESGTISDAGSIAISGVTANFDTALALPALSITNATVIFAVDQTNAGTWQLNGTTLNGPGSLTNAIGATLTLYGATINDALTNNGTLVVTYTAAFDGPFSNAADATLDLDGGQATFANGFTNNGAIDSLNNPNANFANSLDITSGALMNATDGTLDAEAPYEFINGDIDNQGSLYVDGSLTWTTAASTNSGSIDLRNGDLTIDLAGSAPTFTDNGTMAVETGQTLTVTGDTLATYTESSSTFSAAGTIVISGVTANFDVPLALPSLTINNGAIVNLGVDETNPGQWQVDSSTIDGPGILTNAVGATLTVYGATINDPITNDGTLVVTYTGTFDGLFSNAANATLQISAEGGLGAGANFATGFTNDGVIDLEGIVTDVAVMTGTLTNASHGTIDALATDQSSLDANIDNEGSLFVDGYTELQGNRQQIDSRAVRCGGNSGPCQPDFTWPSNGFASSGLVLRLGDEVFRPCEGT